jgi:hypothetical protein
MRGMGMWKKKKTDPTCGSCYWREGEECRRFPPTVVKNPITGKPFSSEYPIVPDNFPACGEYERD